MVKIGVEKFLCGAVASVESWDHWGRKRKRKKNRSGSPDVFGTHSVKYLIYFSNLRDEIRTQEGFGGCFTPSKPV